MACHLASQTGIKPQAQDSESTESPNHWTTRGFPYQHFESLSFTSRGSLSIQCMSVLLHFCSLTPDTLLHLCLRPATFSRGLGDAWREGKLTFPTTLCQVWTQTCLILLHNAEEPQWLTQLSLGAGFKMKTNLTWATMLFPQGSPCRTSRLAVGQSLGFLTQNRAPTPGFALPWFQAPPTLSLRSTRRKQNH